jgi:hypothetical protein
MRENKKTVPKAPIALPVVRVTPKANGQANAVDMMENISDFPAFQQKNRIRRRPTKLLMPRETLRLTLRPSCPSHGGQAHVELQRPVHRKKREQ